MEGYCLTGQSQQWAVLPMEEKTFFGLPLNTKAY